MCLNFKRGKIHWCWKGQEDMRSKFQEVHHVDTDMLCIPTITHFWKNRIRGESEREEERDWIV